jgi:hypothetical protein
VLIDTQSSGNVLYLPLDQMTGGAGATKRSIMPPLVTPQSGEGSADSTGSTRAPNREGRQ